MSTTQADPNIEDIARRVRLNGEQLKVIQESFIKSFLPGDHLWLFGSRADVTKRGGDIDLYIETQEDDITKIDLYERRFYMDLITALGDQKIDIIIKFKDSDQFIYKEARRTGVQII
jgi:hypothetical protein